MILLWEIESLFFQLIQTMAIEFDYFQVLFLLDVLYWFQLMGLGRLLDVLIIVLADPTQGTSFPVDDFSILLSCLVSNPIT